MSRAILVASIIASMPIGAAQAADAEQIVSTMYKLAGRDGAPRPSGAKGQCFVGTYEPAPGAVGITKSETFTKPHAVLARFSVGGSNPKVADATRAANRGLAIRFDPDGTATSEFVMVNAPVNFAKTPDQMLAFLQARLPGADGKPDPEKIKAFTEANPETTGQSKFLASKPIPGSWVGVNYWAVHAYSATNAKGETQKIKLKFAPVGGEVGLTDDEVKSKPTDFLAAELLDRIKNKRPAGLNVVAIIGEPSDPANDITKMWPEDNRKQVVLGTVEITAQEENSKCDDQIFDPTNLAEGLAGPKDDPMFEIRQDAYAVSLSRRAK